MLVQFRVTDAGTGKGIARATVAIIDDNGSPTGAGAIADNDGNVTIDNSQIDNVGYNLQVSSIGYETQSIDPQDADNYGVNLQSASATLPTVTVKALPKTKPANLAPVLLVGAGVLALTMATKSKKIAGVKTNNILLVGGLGVAAFLAYELINKKSSQPQIIYQQPQQSVLQQQSQQLSQGQQTAAIVSAAGTAAGAILTAISNF